MREAKPPVRRWTRRSFLGVGAASALWAVKGQESAGEAKKFLDAATEFEILRVTDLAHNAWLPLASNRALSRRGDALLFASDAGGTAPQLYRHDYKLNRIRQLTEAEKLNTNTFTLLAGDRNFLYVDGRKLMAGGARERVVYEMPEEWSQWPRIAASEDGLTVALSSSNGTKTRIALAGRAGTVLEERAGDIGTFHLRPRRAAVSYVADGVARYLPLDTRKPATLKTAPGEVLSAHWSPDGAALLYLLKPAEAGRLTEIREYAMESGKDALVAKTSQYVHFQRNGDATVFLGASGSKASPHLILMLRSVKRELTICEHRCSEARQSRAAFSPNSSRIAFQTDRHGNMAIYSMAVDRLIEQTDENT